MAQRAAKRLVEERAAGAGLRPVRAAALAVAQHEGVDGRQKTKFDNASSEQRIAPAEHADRELGQGDEDRAGEAADQGQGGDARAVALGMERVRTAKTGS